VMSRPARLQVERALRVDLCLFKRFARLTGG
jgi:hypothetical protein